MFTAAIVEDRNEDASLLQAHLKRFCDETGEDFRATRYDDPASFLAAQAGGFDLVLMDIDLPGMNGMECARRLRETDSGATLIFITNLARYAVHGYEVNALDFIIKPVTYPVFSMKLKRAVNSIRRSREQYLNLNIKGGLVRIEVSRVYYLEVMRHYITYHTEQGNFVVRETLKAAEEKLTGCHFARASVSHLVNLQHVRLLMNGCIHMADGDIYLSRSHKQDFMKALADYMGGNA